MYYFIHIKTGSSHEAKLQNISNFPPRLVKFNSTFLQLDAVQIPVTSQPSFYITPIMFYPLCLGTYGIEALLERSIEALLCYEECQSRPVRETQAAGRVM